MTAPDRHDGQRADILEELRRLLDQFDRFGVATGLPDHIRVVDGGREAVERSRNQLVEMLNQDPRVQALRGQDEGVLLGSAELESLRLELIKLCVQGRLQVLLAEAGVAYPIYNFFAGFDDNALGPWDREFPDGDVVSPIAWKLMGIPIRSPLGIPASGLTANARWIRYFARRGFNVLTFKTVRSCEFLPHRWPHWVFIEDIDPWHNLDDVREVRGDLDTWPKDLSRFSTANSFGVPSPSPERWQAEVEKSLSALTEGQLLIVSVMGTGDHFHGLEFVRDFVRVAQLAEDAGARAIELNLSCPNNVSSEGAGMHAPLCSDSNATAQVVRAVRGEIDSETRLVAKLSALPAKTLEAVLSEVGEEVDAISGINTVQAPIRNPDDEGSPFVGVSSDASVVREKAGVSGAVIRNLGLNFVRMVNQKRSDMGHRYSLIGMGGVMSAGDVHEYFAAGSDAVQTATGACLHPELAAQTDPSVISKFRTVRHPSRAAKIVEAVATGGYSLLSSRK